MKKTTKKIGALLLGGMMTLMTAGCGNSNSTASNAAPTTQAVTEASGETTAESAEQTASESDETSQEEVKSALPKIGIAWAEDPDGEYSEDVQMYIKAVEKAGAEAIMLPRVENEEEAKAALASVGAVIMTGGEDISPSYYNEEPDEMLGEVNDARDTSDFFMITAALKEDVPMLATCRGFQMLNVVCGGTLYQDIPTQYETEISHRDPALEEFTRHEITVNEGTKIAEVMGEGTKTVNSWHHQCVKDLGEGLTVEANAPDGIVESAVMEDKTYVMGVQFHPEWHVEDGEDDFLKFFTVLAEYAAK